MAAVTAIGWVLLTVISSAASAEVSYCRGNARYKVSFIGMWNESGGQSHEFPADAAFSPFTLASHDGDYTMWRPMTKASTSVKNVAETGDNSDLLEELASYREAGKVYDIQKSTTLTEPSGQIYTYLHTTPQFRFFSVVSMIFPSPDWFIGVYNTDMCVGETAKWIRRRTINLYAWDAGTDSGKNFTSANLPTVPAKNITLIMREDDPESSFQIPDDQSDPMYKYVPKFGTAVFELESIEDNEKRSCQALGTQTYRMQFYGLWSEESHPKAFPADAQFFRPIVTSHSDDYVLWAANTTIFRPDSRVGVASYEAAPELNAPDVFLEAELELNMEFHYISAVAGLWPRPDWFVGFSSIDMCDGYFWKDGPIVFYLQPWDSGTHDGMTFLDAGNVTDPQQPITRITTDTMGSFYNRARQHIAPLVRVTLDRTTDSQTDYQNLLETWRIAFNDFQDQFEQWKAGECPSG